MVSTQSKIRQSNRYEDQNDTHAGIYAVQIGESTYTVEYINKTPDRETIGSHCRHEQAAEGLGRRWKN